MSTSPAQDPFPERSFLQYKILEKLGSGGMGQVYKARDTRLNRFVAIKMLPDHLSADPERRRRFILEAQAASALNHPNIITIYDVVYNDETHYMVVEYIDGKTLTDLIPKGGLRVPQAIQYAVQIADGLCSAHVAGIIHRDLKPSNIMIGGSGHLKLLDFGLAKVIEAELAEPDTETRTMLTAAMTVEGTLMGTVNYMSPEQAEGKRVDARSDIFSFGAVLYEMLTGCCAFQGGSTVATLSAVLRDDVMPIAELATGVPPELEQIVMKCLKKAPAERFQSMRELQTALAPLKLHSEASTLRDRTGADFIPANFIPVVAPRRKGGGLRWGIGLLVLLGVAGAYWFTTQQHPAEQPPKTPRVASVSPPSDAVSKPSPVNVPPEPVEPKAPVTVTVNDGLSVRLILAEDIPANAAEGTALKFEVAGDIRISNTLVIRKGAAATGSIVDGAKRLLGLGKKMTFRLETVVLADGETMSLRATPTPSTSGPSQRSVDNGGNKKAKDVASAAGTAYVGYVDGSKTLDDLRK